MGYAIPLKQIGAYALDQLELAIASVAAEEEALMQGWGPVAQLKAAEIVIAFATADGSVASPAILVVGEAPLPPDQIRKQLEPLSARVLVARADVQKAPAAAIGRLVLRVIFPMSKANPGSQNT
jgi:hypothetical protein